jgi:hypothetical protein
MSIKGSKWLLRVAFLFLLTPAFALGNGPHNPGPGSGGPNGGGCNFWDRQQCWQQVPEGGTAVSYLLIVGTTCLGAMALRSRYGKRGQV